MKIKEIRVKNFRLLENFTVNMEDELSLIIGKNNTGKTSFLSVLDKFINKKVFSLHDFNLNFKKTLLEKIESSDSIEEEKNIGIKLHIIIEYDENDNLGKINKLMIDLDPENNIIVLAYEYVLNSIDFDFLKQEFNLFKKNET